METSVFSGQLFEHLDDDDYRSLQLGDSAEDVIYLIYLYAKNQQANLRPDQLKLLKRTIEEDLK